jgi:hypothetical protein
MANLPGLAIIGQAGGEPLAQPQAGISGLQQHGAAIAAPVMLVKAGDEGLVKKFGKPNTLWRGRIRHCKASAVRKVVSHLLSTTPGAFSFSDFMNYSG